MTILACMLFFMIKQIRHKLTSVYLTVCNSKKGRRKTRIGINTSQDSFCTCNPYANFLF